MKFWKLLAVVAIFICACSRGREFSAAYELSVAESNTIDVGVAIDSVSYKFPFARNFYVHSDSILVVVNRVGRNRHVIELADLSNGTIYAGTLLYGNGPSEVLQCNEHFRDGIVYVNDFQRRRLVAVNVDRLMKERDSYRPEILLDYQLAGLTPYVCKLDDSVFLFENPYCFKEKSMRIDNNTDLRFYSGSKDDLPKARTNRYKWETYNVSQGKLIPFPDKNRIIYASSYNPLIEIYDVSGHLLKVIKGPTDLRPDYATTGNEVCFKGRAPYAYMAYCVIGEYLLLNYIGGFLGTDSNYSDLKSLIMKFDLDGNCLEAYRLPRYISSFSVVTDGTIYGKGFDNDGVTVLWHGIPKN